MSNFRCPDNPERREKIETIRMLFINMHHLINEYRPVQARDTLRHMMVKQNREIKVSFEILHPIIFFCFRLSLKRCKTTLLIPMRFSTKFSPPSKNPIMIPIYLQLLKHILNHRNVSNFILCLNSCFSIIKFVCFSQKVELQIQRKQSSNE